MNIPTFSVALSTLRGFSRDRIFHATILFAIFFIMFTYFLSTLTIIETRKILLDFGFAAISLCGVAISLFVGLNAVGKEVESRTIYTILSKPISRTSYLLGKYLGCVTVCIITHAIMSITLVAIVASVGEGLPQGIWACFYLMVLESLLILAVATFFSLNVSSTFLAGCLTLGVFFIGRSSYSLYLVAKKSDSVLIKTVLKIVYDVFPALERFNIRELVAYAKPYPAEMVTMGTVYCAGYIILFLVLAAAIFQRKDMP